MGPSPDTSRGLTRSEEKPTREVMNWGNLSYLFSAGTFANPNYKDLINIIIGESFLIHLIGEQYIFYHNKLTFIIILVYAT